MNFKKILVKAPTTLTGNYEVLDETRYILNNAFKSVDVDQVIWDEKTTDEIKQMTYGDWGLSSGDIISASNWFIIIDPTDEKYFKYTNINEYIIISGLNSGYPQHIKLPSLIDGKPVVGIDDSAFKDSNLTAINFHHGLSSIFMGSGLFENCTGLSSFKVPESIDRIKDNMFKDCSELTSLELHDNILEFGDHAFDGCSKLTSIINNIPDTLTSLGNYVFGNFNFTEIHLPGSLTNIGASAFTNNANVSMVYMEKHSIASILANPNYPFGLKDDTNISCLDGTIYVNKGVFYTRHDPEYCNGYLTAITEPNKQNCITGFNSTYFYNTEEEISSTALIPLYVLDNEVYGVSCDHYHNAIEKDIAENNTNYSGLYGKNLIIKISAVTVEYGLKFIDFAFFNYNRLYSISLPNSLTSIGRFTFFGCNKLSTLEIPNSVLSIGNYAFGNCTNLQTIDIPQNITTISEYLFSNCTSLSNIVLKESVTNINDYAFINCSNLSNIELPSNINVIKNSVFENCTSLLSITIPNSVNSIGLSIFNKCSNISSVTFNNSNIVILPDYTFNECLNLTDITLPTSLETINSYAFNNCQKLSTITLPDNLTIIKNHAFNNCSSLLSIDLPEHVNEIHKYAFSNCYNLSNIVFNNITINKLNQYTFNNCSSLTSIILPTSITDIQNYTFNNCQALKDINIEDLANLSIINGYTFNNCYKLKSLILPESTLSICGFAFNNCSSLTSITIPESVSLIEEFTFVNCDNLAEIIFKNKTIDDISLMTNYENWKIGYKYINNIENQIKSISSEQRGTDCVLKVYYNAKQHLVKYSDGFKYYEAKAEDDSTAILTGFEFSEQSLNTINEIGTLIIPSTLNNKNIKSIFNPSLSNIGQLSNTNEDYSKNYSLNFKNLFINLSSLPHKSNSTIPSDILRFELSTLQIHQGALSTGPDNPYAIIYKAFSPEYASNYTMHSKYWPYYSKFEYVTMILQFINQHDSEHYHFKSSGNSTNLRAPEIYNGGLYFNGPGFVKGSYGFTFDAFKKWSINKKQLHLHGYINNQKFSLLSNTFINLSIENGIEHISPPVNVNALTSWSLNPINHSFYKSSDSSTIFNNFKTKYFSKLLSNYVLSINTEDNIYNSNIKFNYGCFDNIYRPNIKDVGYIIPQYTKTTFELNNDYKNWSSPGFVRLYCSLQHCYVDQNRKVIYPTSIKEVLDRNPNLSESYLYNDMKKWHPELQKTIETMDAEGNLYFHNSTKAPRCCGIKPLLNNIILPSTLTYIGNYAFYNSHCININLSDCTNLKYIGSNAFNNFGLGNTVGNIGYGMIRKTIQLPDSLEIIDDLAFNKFSYIPVSTRSQQIYNSEKRTYINLYDPETFKRFNNIKHNLRLGNNLRYIGTGSLDGFTCVSSGQFWYENINDKKMIFYPTVTWMTNVTIPDSVLYIKENAFTKCKLLSSINFHNNVRWIGDYALSGLTNLLSITLPSSLEYLPTGVFKDCKSLSNVNLNNIQAIGSNVFQGCKNLTSINLSETINTIMDYAFSGSGIKEITIPSSVTSIGNYAFFYCSGLTSVTISEGVTSIGNEAFRDCSALTSVTIPEGATSIGLRAFRGCSGLTSVIIPSSVTSIGVWAFYGCTSLNDITFDKTKQEVRSMSNYPWKIASGKVIKCTDGNLTVS